MKLKFSSLGFLALLALLTLRADAADYAKPDQDGYIRDWLMLAPIPLPEGRSGSDLILADQVKNEADLRPKAGDKIKVNEKELSWKHITAETNFFDFNAILNTVTDRVAGYMVTYIECDRDWVGVTMAVGSNDEGRIYLNGIDIYAFTEPRPLQLDSEKGHVRLNKGLNVVVFKVINEQNSWQGAMRFLDKSGAPMTDLKIKLSP